MHYPRLRATGDLSERASPATAHARKEPRAYALMPLQPRTSSFLCPHVCAHTMLSCGPSRTYIDEASAAYLTYSGVKLPGDHTPHILFAAGGPLAGPGIAVAAPAAAVAAEGPCSAVDTGDALTAGDATTPGVAGAVPADVAAGDAALAGALVGASAGAGSAGGTDGAGESVCPAGPGSPAVVPADVAAPVDVEVKAADAAAPPTALPTPLADRVGVPSAPAPGSPKDTAAAAGAGAAAAPAPSGEEYVAGGRATTGSFMEDGVVVGDDAAPASSVAGRPGSGSFMEE
jgi:hypothetical protein